MESRHKNDEALNFKSVSSSSSTSMPDHSIMLSNDWRSYGGAISSFDDGHIPENLKDSNKETKIVQYDLFQQQDPVVHVFNDALDTDLLDVIYTKTAGQDSESKGKNAWGDYVTIEQIKRCWENNNDSESSIVVKMTAEYLRLALGEGTKPPKQYPSSKRNPQPLFSREQLKEVHGVAVWGLAAPSGVSVLVVHDCFDRQALSQLIIYSSMA